MLKCIWSVDVEVNWTWFLLTNQYFSVMGSMEGCHGKVLEFDCTSWSQWEHGNPDSLTRMGILLTGQEYKYLGVYLNNKLDWTRNAEAVYKKGQSRLFFPQEAEVL